MRLYLIAAILTLSSVGNAALISRSYTYTDGNTITANENNTNENTLYNEINGNLNNANILDGGIATADFADSAVTTAKIADANVTTAKLSTTLQSTVTVVGQMLSYRRPVLKTVSVTAADVENNTGTLNQTCILFADERRCVTEDTGVTTVNRRFIITESASLSGTKNSGLRSGYVEAVNTWYSLYAVKVTDVATDFVIVGDTVTPVQANFSALNTAYGTNGWVYLGLIRNGDNSGATGDILAFQQVGNYTHFYNNMTANGEAVIGTLLATSAAATTLTYSYVAGFGAAQLPGHITNVIYGGDFNGAAANSTSLRDSSNARIYVQQDSVLARFKGQAMMAAVEGAQLRNSAGAATTCSIFLVGFWDGVLGVGSNPQL